MVRRGAGADAGLQAHLGQEVLHGLPRPRRGVRGQDPLLDDPADGMCGRQRQRLHRLRHVGDEVGRDQGMTATARTEGDLGTRGRVSAFFAGKRRLRLTALLLPPMFWLVVVYLGALAYLLVSAFWGLHSFTGDVVHTYGTANLHAVFTRPLYRTVAVRTLGIALMVTVIDAVVAFPMAFYMS